MSGERTAITHELYQELLALWLIKPSISHLVLGVGVPRAIIQQLVKTGVPELDLPPFPQLQEVRGHDSRPVQETKLAEILERHDVIAESGEMSLSARVAVAKQDAERTIAALKAKLAAVEAEAANLGDTAAIAETRAELDGTLAEFSAAEARVRVEEARISRVGRTTIVHDRLQTEAKRIAVVQAAIDNVMNLGVIMSYITDKMVAAVEQDKISLPDTISPKLLASLAGSADRLTMAMERATNMQKSLPSAPDSLAMRIGRALENLTEDQIQEVRRTGRLPARRLGSGAD